VFIPQPRHQDHYVTYRTASHRLEGIQEVMDALAGARSVILTTHINADGDGAGCQAAVASWLRARDVQAWIVNPSPFPESFAFLLDEPECVVDVKSSRAEEVCRNADLALVLDTGEIPRIGRVKPLIDHLPKAVIDHHPRGEMPFEGPSFIDATAAAAGELVFDLIHSVDGPWTWSVVDGLYVAILTDTGSFAHSNTSAGAYRVMAELVDRGARPEPIHRQCYGSIPLRKWRLLEKCLPTLQVDEAGTTAWMTVPPTAFQETGATPEDLEGLSDYPRSLAGVEVGMLFRTTDDGSTKISFRSNGGVNVNAVARSFGGGGHVRASGALVPRPVEEVRSDAIQAVQAAVEELMEVRAAQAAARESREVEA
jgi:phosphoesterase RecJ-like protein